MNQPQPTPGDIYVATVMADHLAHCAPCRQWAKETDARSNEYGESIRRRDRLTLGLRTTRTTAVTA
ncbi:MULTISPECIES: hypothetical protein [unclassified Streptomyces]|uniref:hypothetical protein n=1 Tax=unclassified Streptomyces TaxID=2593676 RepID=UPI004040F071